jgi:hypothetical protein
VDSWSTSQSIRNLKKTARTSINSLKIYFEFQLSSFDFPAEMFSNVQVQKILKLSQAQELTPLSSRPGKSHLAYATQKAFPSLPQAPSDSDPDHQPEAPLHWARILVRPVPLPHLPSPLIWHRRVAHLPGHPVRRVRPLDVAANTSSLVAFPPYFVVTRFSTEAPSTVMTVVMRAAASLALVTVTS